MRTWKRASMLFLLLCFPMVAQARAPYGMAGCGLGSVVIGPSGGQISAATTNGSTSTQGFGISSGTSNCLEPSRAAAVEAQKQFFTENLATLSKEMAQGEGDSLRALSDTFGCSQEAYPTFAAQLQSSYSNIFAAPGSIAALSEVESVLKSNETLSSSCNLLI